MGRIPEACRYYLRARDPWVLRVGGGRVELRGELSQREAQATLDRPQWDPEPLRDLGLGETSEVAELDRLTLTLGQRAQRDADVRGLEAEQRLLVGPLGRLLVAVCDGLRARIVAGPPDGVDRTIAGDSQEPAAQAAAIGPVVVTAAPEGDERLLHDVFGGRALAQHPVRQTVTRRCVTVVDRAEGTQVVTGETSHQDTVVSIFELRTGYLGLIGAGTCGGAKHGALDSG